MEKQQKIFLIAIITILIIFAFLRGPLDWDALVYIMNAKNFLHGYVYHEDFRPPLLPATYAVLFKIFSETEAIPRILSLLFSIATAFILFFLVKKFYGKKIAYYSTAFFVFSGAFLIWSNDAYTEIPSLLLTMLAVLAYLKGKNNWFLVAGVMASLAGMMKYTAIYIIISFFLYEIFIRKNFKGYVIFLLAFALATSSWLYYNWLSFHNPFYPMQENFKLSNSPNTITQNVDVIVGLNPFVILGALAYILKHKFTQNDKIFALFFLPIMLFFLFSHREARYFIPSYSLFTTLAAVYFTKNFKRAALKILVISSIVMIAYASFIVEITNQYNETIEQVSLSMKSLDGTIYSNFWPYIAYYAEKDVGAFPWSPERLVENIQAHKVQYFAVEFYPSLDTCYLWNIDKLPFLNKLTDKETLYSQVDVSVYQIDYTKFSPSQNYASILRC